MLPTCFTIKASLSFRPGYPVTCSSFLIYLQGPKPMISLSKSASLPVSPTSFFIQIQKSTTSPQNYEKKNDEENCV